MAKLTLLEKALVVSVATAGISVAATAALAAHRDIKAEETSSSEEIELKLPSLPASKEEFLEDIIKGYVQNKSHVSNMFRIVGQMCIAPIAMIAIDALYGIYVNRVEANSRATSGASF